LRFISQDPHFVRRWATARGLAPFVGPGGAIELAAPGGPDGATPLSWEEFAGFFTAEALALAYDGPAGTWSIRRGLRTRRAPRGSGWR